MTRIKQDLDLTGVLCRAIDRKDLQVATAALELLFPGEVFDQSQLEIKRKEGVCPFITDVFIFYKGKRLMGRESTTRTGFHFHYKSPIFDNPKSK